MSDLLALHKPISPALKWALLASVLLHVALFALRAPEYEPAPSPPPIEARILEAGPIATAPSNPPPSAPASPQPKRVVKSEKPLPAKREPLVQNNASAEIASPSPAPITNEKTNTSESASSTPPVEAAAASAPSVIADPSAIARYRISLMSVAERYKRFPEYAREREWQGRSDWHIEVGADGRLRELRLKKSSGYEVLDRAAGEMLRNAQPETPLPADLQGRHFDFAVGVVFNFSERR